MNSAILLAKENQDLQAAHEKQQQKGRQSNWQIAHTEGLSIQEAQELIQHKNETQETQGALPVESASSTVQHPVQVPPRCSDCHVIGHKRLQCPNHSSN